MFCLLIMEILSLWSTSSWEGFLRSWRSLRIRQLWVRWLMWGSVGLMITAGRQVWSTLESWHGKWSFRPSLFSRMEPISLSCFFREERRRSRRVLTIRCWEKASERSMRNLKSLSTSKKPFKMPKTMQARKCMASGRWVAISVMDLKNIDYRFRIDFHILTFKISSLKTLPSDLTKLRI